MKVSTKYAASGLSEIWLPVPGFPDYEVSNLGRVKSNTRKGAGKILKVHTNPGGYAIVNYSNNGKRKCLTTHRVVMSVFNPHPKSAELTINHINSDRLDNRLENLEWCTQQENIDHAIKFGSRDHTGVKHPRAQFTETEVRAMRSIAPYHGLASDLAMMLEIPVPTIQSILRGRSWRHI